jgi:hypothetical protein
MLTRAPAETERDFCGKLDRRQREMESVKDLPMQVWKLIAQHMIPQLENMLDWDSTRPYEKYGKLIYDGTALAAVRIQAVGFQGNTISERLRWFNYGFPLDEIGDTPEHKQYLEDREAVLYAAFRRSNLYSEITRLFMHAGSLGTAVMHPKLDRKSNRLKYRLLHPREYYLQENEDREVDTIHRVVEIPARRAWLMFPQDRLSDAIRNAAQNAPDKMFRFMHVVQPNNERHLGSYLSEDKPWLSCVKEYGESRIVEKSGYDIFPYFAWRWYPLEDGPYGGSPAWDALFDIIGLNRTGRDLREAVHKMAFPPMVAKREERGILDFGPAGVTLVEDMAQKPEQLAQQVRLDGPLQHVADTREIIKQHFNVNFFLMWDELDGERTAEEVRERRAEKAVMLGPASGTLQHGVLRPIVEHADMVLSEAGEMPEPPESLREYDGLEFKIDFMSPLAEAQERLASQGVVGFLGTVLPLAETFGPEILDGIDPDELLDVIGERESVPPMILRSREKRQAIREGRAAAQREAVEVEGENIEADTASKLAKAGMPVQARKAAPAAAPKESRRRLRIERGSDGEMVGAEWE